MTVTDSSHNPNRPLQKRRCAAQCSPMGAGGLGGVSSLLKGQTDGNDLDRIAASVTVATSDTLSRFTR